MNVNIEKLEDEAIRLLELGRLRRSERLFKKVLMSDPSSLTSNFNLARVYRMTRQYKLALYHARRAIRMNRHELNAHLNLALIYDLIGKPRLALLNYKKELCKNPYSAETLWSIGRFYFSKKRWRKASVYLERCFNTGYVYDLEDTIYKLGSCYLNLGDPDSYKKLYTTYIKMAPDSAWAYANLGHCLLGLKDFRGAALNLLRAKRAGWKSVDADLNLAKRGLHRMSARNT
jgi:Tfp pilus assembly protein PilF